MTVRGERTKDEATDVASPRSRKSGQIAQEKHIEQVEGLVKNLEKLMSGEFQLQVEPLIPKKIDKIGGCNLNIMPKGYGPGIEDSCKWVYDNVNRIVSEKTLGRVWIEKVRVYEHENNWAEYQVR